MGYFVECGVGSSCVQLLLTVKLKHYFGLFFEYLVLFFFLLCLVKFRRLIILLGWFNGLGERLLAPLTDVREVQDDFLTGLVLDRLLLFLLPLKFLLLLLNMTFFNWLSDLLLLLL